MDGISAPSVAFLRSIAGAEASAVKPAAVPRDRQLARELDERLTNRLEQIRAGLADAEPQYSTANHADRPGPGQRLDILA